MSKQIKLEAEISHKKYAGGGEKYKNNVPAPRSGWTHSPLIQKPTAMQTPGFPRTGYKTIVNFESVRKNLRPVANNPRKSKQSVSKQSVNKVKLNKNVADEKKVLSGARNVTMDTKNPKRLKSSNPSNPSQRHDTNNPNPPSRNQHSRNTADPIRAIEEVRYAAAPAALIADPIKEASGHPKHEIVPYNSQKLIPKELDSIIANPKAQLTGTQQNELALLLTAGEGKNPSTPQANDLKKVLNALEIENGEELKQAFTNPQVINYITKLGITLNLNVVNSIVNNNYYSPVLKPGGPVYPGISAESAAAASTAAAAILSSMSFSREPEPRTSLSSALNQQIKSLKAINASSNEKNAQNRQRKANQNSKISGKNFITRMFATVFRGYPLKTVRKKLSSTIKRLSNQFETQRRVEETMEEREKQKRIALYLNKQKQTQSKEPVLQTIMGGSKPGNGFSIQPKVINGITKNNLSSNSTKSIKGVTKSKEAKKYSNRKIMKTHRKSMKKTTKATKITKTTKYKTGSKF